MVRTSPSLIANQRALDRREAPAPLSSRRHDDRSASSHARGPRQQDRDRDVSPRRSSSYNEHRPASARRRNDDRGDSAFDPIVNNEFAPQPSYSGASSRSHSQHTSRSLRDKHSEEKDLVETYEAEIRRIQELRKQLLMPVSPNGPVSRRAASPPSVPRDDAYSNDSRLHNANHGDYHERQRQASARQSDPARLGVSPPHAVSSLANRRGTDPQPARVHDQHSLQQNRLDLYFGNQSVPVIQRTISDSQRTSNGDGYLCDVDEDDGNENRKRRESEATENIDENDDSSSGDDGRAEGQEDEGGAKSQSVSPIKSHSVAVLTRASTGRSPSVKSIPAHSPHEASAVASLPPSQHASSALRAASPPFQRSSPPLRAAYGSIPELPSLASSVRSYHAPDRSSSAYQPSDPSNYPPSSDYHEPVRSSSPNWAPAYNVPIVSRHDDQDPRLPFPPSSSPSAPNALAAKREHRTVAVESEAVRALHLTVGAHESSEPAKSCCVVM